MGTPKPLPREKDGLWLTKDNKLIMMHGNMTVTTYKITNYFLYKAQQENRLDNLSVDAKTIVADCNIKNTNYSKVLFEECKKVAITQISMMDDAGNWRIRQIIPSMTYENGILTAYINPQMAPYIQGLTKNFTKADMLIANKCDTYSAFKMYEICNSWIRTGYAFYSIDEWRELLGGTSYDSFSGLKQRVITPAIDVVNRCTDIEITPEFIKTGRKTTHMKVFIKKKPCLLAAVETAEVNEPVVKVEEEEVSAAKNESAFSLIEIDTIRAMVKDFRQKKKDAEAYVKNYGVEYCKEQMEYVRQEDKRQKLKRIGGYFRKAMEGDYAGSKQINIEAARAEEREHREIQEWNREAASMNNLIENSGSMTEDELVKNILQEHPEVASLYQALGITDKKIARWIEKYSEVLLLKLGIKMQGKSGITAEYIEANLNINEKK